MYNKETRTYEPIKPKTAWKTLGRGPHVSVMGLAVDLAGNIPIIHRGPKVRSVKNRWSLPSGLHENGFTMPEQLALELDEELGLTVAVDPYFKRPLYCEHVGVYENIVVGDGADEDDWHWVIHVFVTLVLNAADYVNKEPHKCDRVLVIKDNNFSHFLVEDTEFKLSPGLGEFLRDYHKKIHELIAEAKQMGNERVASGQFKVVMSST